MSKANLRANIYRGGRAAKSNERMLCSRIYLQTTTNFSNLGVQLLFFQSLRFEQILEIVSLRLNHLHHFLPFTQTLLLSRDVSTGILRDVIGIEYQD